MDVRIGHFAQKQRFRLGHVLPFTGRANAKAVQTRHRCFLRSRRPLQGAGSVRRWYREYLRVVRVVVEQRIVYVLGLVSVAEEFDVLFLTKSANKYNHLKDQYL